MYGPTPSNVKTIEIVMKTRKLVRTKRIIRFILYSSRDMRYRALDVVDSRSIHSRAFCFDGVFYSSIGESTLELLSIFIQKVNEKR